MRGRIDYNDNDDDNDRLSSDNCQGALGSASVGLLVWKIPLYFLFFSPVISRKFNCIVRGAWQISESSECQEDDKSLVTLRAPVKPYQNRS